MHLPFVHYNTIGRGNRTLVNGPVVEWRGEDRFFVRVFNEVDTGQRPRTADEIAPPYPAFHLDFIFPNLWQNWIADKVRVGAAFVPVDGEHTLLYLRFYQKFLPGPLGQLVARLAMPMNLRIAHQDRRVVQTQQPKPSGLKIGENLVAGDGPIVAYRKHRAGADGRGQGLSGGYPALGFTTIAVSAPSPVPPIAMTLHRMSRRPASSSLPFRNDPRHGAFARARKPLRSCRSKQRLSMRCRTPSRGRRMS